MCEEAGEATSRTACFASHLSDLLHWYRVSSHEDLLQQDHLAPSYPAHGKVPHLQKTCAECFYPFSTNLKLEQHASSSGHTAFSCTCKAKYSRASTLTRHINSMIRASFPCELCDNKAFSRLDKLGDHLRRWHRLGLKAFDQYKGGNSPLSSATRLSGGIPPAQAEAPQQTYPVISGFDPLLMFDEFSSASNIMPETSWRKSSTSPGSSTVRTQHPENWDEEHVELN